MLDPCYNTAWLAQVMQEDDGLTMSRGGREPNRTWSHENKGIKRCGHEHTSTTRGFIRCRDCDGMLSPEYERKKSAKAASIRPCLHPHLKTFTFSDGKTIQSCPDCAEFDAKRWDVLGTNPPKYGSTEYVIGGAPFLHASQIISVALPIKRSIMRPDGTYGWTSKSFKAPKRKKESYENNPRIVAAFKSHSSRLQNLIRRKIRPHVVSDTLATVTAQELESDLWMKAIVHIGTFREESAFTTWLHTIAENTADDWIKAHKRFKRNGEELYDFTEGENEDGEPEGGYPDAKQDGVYTSTGKFIPTEPTVDSLHAAYLGTQRKLIYRKPAAHKHAEAKTAWAPESRELYLDACQQLRQRAAKTTHRMSSKVVGQGTA